MYRGYDTFIGNERSVYKLSTREAFKRIGQVCSKCLIRAHSDYGLSSETFAQTPLQSLPCQEDTVLEFPWSDLPEDLGTRVRVDLWARCQD